MIDLYCYHCGAVGYNQVGHCDSCDGWRSFVTLDVHRMLCRDDPVRAKTLPQPVKRSGGGHSVPLACNVVPDRMTEHYDYAVGATIDSRSQKRRVYKENDMIMVSAAEEARKKGMPTLKTKVRSYPGQKDHRSSSERWTGARTKTGQQVV